MTTVTATFADGTTVTRTDKRAPGVAWRLAFPNGKKFGGTGCNNHGFAADQQKAERAAKTLAAWLRKAGDEKAYGGAPSVEIVSATVL